MNSFKNIRDLQQQASIYIQSGEMLRAKVVCIKLLKLTPEDPQLLAYLGVIESKLGNVHNSVEFLEKSIAIKPNQPNVLSNLAVSLIQLNLYEKALLCLSQALKQSPSFLMAYFTRGVALNELKRYEEAIADYTKAIEIQPHFADAYCNRGVALNELKRYEEAIADYTKAISFQPLNAKTYNNLGKNFNELGRYSEALRSYDKAIKINPNYAEAYSNRGIVFNKLKKFNEAICDFSHAIRINPSLGGALYNRAIAFSDANLFENAILDYDRAITLDPELEFIFGDRLNAKMHICDWDDYESSLSELEDAIATNKKTTIPFYLLGLIDNPKIQNKCTQIYVSDKFSSANILTTLAKYSRHDRIRIGYFSSDFRNHAVSYLTAELFELHDRNKFEVFAFSLGSDTKDFYRKRLEGAFDRFLDLKNKTDQEIVAIAREIELDIAIDLGGFTADSRTNIFSMRAAPIQLSYIGYLGTMGIKNFDYLVADATIIPEEVQQYYSEKIVYLPCYQVNDRKREISEKVFTREELGLPSQTFVFCSLNNIYKITPATFDSWMRILRVVEHSVLFLLDDNDVATNNLKKEAEARGVSAERLIFAKRLPMPEYLARYRVADIFLDTLPYNAGTTASDALRVGLPVLTQIGNSFASRMAASLLNAVGLPELITCNHEDYEALAIELATNEDKLQELKRKLLRSLPLCQLYNSSLFTKNIETAYQIMYQRYQDDLEPNHIYLNH